MEGLPLDVIRSCIVPYLSILEIHSLSCTSRMLRHALGHHPHMVALQNLVKDYTPERVLIETAKRQDPTLFFYILGRRGGARLDMATFQSIARVTPHVQVFEAATLLCCPHGKAERFAYNMTKDFHMGRLGIVSGTSQTISLLYPAGASFAGRVPFNQMRPAWRVMAGDAYVHAEIDSLYAALCDALFVDVRIPEDALWDCWDRIGITEDERFVAKYLRVIRRLAILGGFVEFEKSLPQKDRPMRCQLPYIYRSDSAAAIKHYAKRFMRKSNRAQAIAGARKNGDRALIEWTINLE